MGVMAGVVSWGLVGCLFAVSQGGIASQDLGSMLLPQGAIWLDSLDFEGAQRGAGYDRGIAASSLTLGGGLVPHGLIVRPGREIAIQIHRSALQFVAWVGVDDSCTEGGSVLFEAWVDDRKIASRGPIRAGEAPKLLSVDLQDAETLVLAVQDVGDGPLSELSGWVGAWIALDPSSKKPPIIVDLGIDEPMAIATGEAPEPAIHGPRVVGTTPGRPFLFLIPATGEGPLSYGAEGLPQGLSVASSTGIITGRVAASGATGVTLRVRGPLGEASRRLLIVAEPGRLALTPVMGWNGWNVWGAALDDQKVRDAAEWMVQTGLAGHGFQTVAIDDGWQGERDAQGEILPNGRFCDMEALAEFVHGRGLKLGLYSSPGPETCAGFPGSYQHEDQDARTYARWGIDYLKYDWCSYQRIAKDASREELMKPYQTMRDSLDRVDRDIVYSLCQYGMGAVWTWGREVGGNLWRTTQDIRDSWTSVSGIGFSQNGKHAFAGPGHWNDPDMLVVGAMGWGGPLRPSRLTRNEQITHITLWSLIAAPLLVGCDLSRLDPFTLDLLSNEEVLDVDQDPRGQPAWRRSKEGLTQVWARPLWDETTAVGLFNLGWASATVTVRWEDLGLQRRQAVRDLWRREDLGPSTDSFSCGVPRHGAVLLKIGEPVQDEEGRESWGVPDQVH